LTGATVPDEVQVKVYTVSGRLIRSMTASGEQLRIGLNTMRWDGRDEDGDLPGNGVYFYKFIMRSATGTIETLGKIAKLK
jgi:flagellar hook assembly protein FlgD